MMHLNLSHELIKKKIKASETYRVDEFRNFKCVRDILRQKYYISKGKRFFQPLSYRVEAQTRLSRDHIKPLHGYKRFLSVSHLRNILIKIWQKNILTKRYKHF